MMSPQEKVCSYRIRDISSGMGCTNFQERIQATVKGGLLDLEKYKIEQKDDLSIATRCTYIGWIETERCLLRCLIDDITQRGALAPLAFPLC